MCGYAHVDCVFDVETKIYLVKPTHVVSFIGLTHGKTANKVFITIEYLEQPRKLTDNLREWCIFTKMMCFFQKHR